MSDGGRLRAFIRELRRRRVLRVAAVYAVVAFVLVQVADLVFPALLLPSWSVRLLIVIAIFGFPIALVLSWLFDVTPTGIRRDVSSGERSAEGAQTTPASEPDPASVAVLPFANMSAEADNAFFSEGLSEELLNLLARIPGLRVSARTSSFAFKGSSSDIREIGRRLGVGTILEGSVRRSGDRVRITAQLIDAGSGYHLWSDQYDRELEDIFAIQEDIARRIVGALEVRLSDRGERALRRISTADVHAYELYLRARHHLNEVTATRLGYAVTLFRRAIEADPSFAPAYSGLANALVFASLWTDPDPALLREAETVAHRALELDPDLAEGHVAAGHVLSLLRRFEEAAKEFEIAIAIDPDLFEAYYYFGRTRLAQGRMAEALELMQRAHAARPEDYQSASLQSMMLRALGRKDEARAKAGHALTVLDRHLELNPDDVRASYLRAQVLEELDRTDEAREAIERARRMAPDDSGVLYNVACLYAKLGDTEQALADLGRALDLGTVHRDWVENDPDMEPVRKDPRYRALLERMS